MTYTSTTTRPEREADGEDHDAVEQMVVGYLASNPQFLSRHPQLARELRVEHGCEGAVSLVEYQLRALRGELDERQAQLSSLLENARHNEEVAMRLHELVLNLLDAEALDELLTRLYQGLENGLGAERIALRVYGAPREAHNHGLAEFVGPAMPLSGALRRVLSTRRPCCGDAKEFDVGELFGDAAHDIGSLCVVPFDCAGHASFLAIASRNQRRYHRGLGTHYLRQLGDVLSRLIGSHL